MPISIKQWRSIMKHPNKQRATTLLATVFAVSIFASQSVMASQEGPQHKDMSHSHAVSTDANKMSNCMKNQRVNYSLPDHSTVQAPLNDSGFPEPEQ